MSIAIGVMSLGLFATQFVLCFVKPQQELDSLKAGIFLIVAAICFK